MPDSSTAVEMPHLEGAATVQEIVSAITTRLENIAQVLEAEHKWLKPKVEFFRKMDDDGIAHDLTAGYIDEAEATEKRGEDNLILRRKNVDRHLENLQGVGVYIRDIAVTIKDVFGDAIEVPA